MMFSHPWVLLMLVVPAGVVVWEVMRSVVKGEGKSAEARRSRAAMPFDGLGGARRAGWVGWVIGAANLAPVGLMAVAIVILAGPKRMSPPAEEREATNIEIVLDVSGSMTAGISGGEAAVATSVLSGKSGSGVGSSAAKGEEDEGGPTRYTAAMGAIKQFCEKRKGDAFGLTIFGSEVIRWMPMTKDLAAIRNAAPFLNPSKMPPGMGGTEIGRALRFAKDLLAQQEEGDRLIILLTDGYSSDLGGSAGLEIAQELVGEKIVVHAVCIGGDEPPREFSDVVAPTGGMIFGASTLEGLNGVFEHISRMQPGKMKGKEREPVDYFEPLVAAGLALLSLHVLCLWGARWTPW